MNGLTRQSKSASDDVRYTAEWITKLYQDEHGDSDPDRDTYGRSSHPTLEAAQCAAVEGSKAANCVEWCRVLEKSFDPTLRIPRHSDAAWDVTRSWCGDWEGNWCES